MPPEQVNPQKDATVLPTTDIFSFGVMMFQLITGQLPFGDLNDERSLIPYLKNGKTGNWNRSLLMQTKGGDKWANTIEGCLQPNLKNRLQSVDDVLRTIPYGSSGIYAEHDNSSDFSNDIVHGILLRVMQGDDYGKVYYLDDILETKRNAILLLGRKSSQYDNDIEISEMHSSYVSRRHCTIELDYDLGKWVIRDGQWVKTSNGGQWLSSTNGTYVNSTEVGSNGLQLKPGDIISVGDTKLRVEGY
jgi:serine/threonine protein kinase